MTEFDREITELTAALEMPEKFQGVINDAIAELERTAVAPGLVLGDPAPDFTLPNASGDAISLSDRLADGPVVLSFYRGDWCPFCNLELRALHAAMPEMRELGASLIAISPQSPDHAGGLVERDGLDFDVLSDRRQTVAEAYRVRFALPADLKDLYNNTFGLDLSEMNAGGEWDLPVPATFVIDDRGIVAAAYASTNYRTRMDPADILTALRQLR